jgi:hypothetical protein
VREERSKVLLFRESVSKPCKAVKSRVDPCLSGGDGVERVELDLVWVLRSGLACFGFLGFLGVIAVVLPRSDADCFCSETFFDSCRVETSEWALADVPSEAR